MRLTDPLPLQCEHRVGLVPGCAPEPEQVLQALRRFDSTERVQPLTASMKSMVIFTWTRWTMMNKSM
jgi:NADH:ubiquinone oxidoreductase subunit B-like Fe-S oxidoreductase